MLSSIRPKFCEAIPGYNVMESCIPSSPVIFRKGGMLSSHDKSKNHLKQLEVVKPSTCVILDS